jgi:hypothetical protein
VFTPPMAGPTDDAGPVTLAELNHLWWFADGAIMDAETRQHLRRSWGLCPRHAWLYFRVETELRIDPLGNAVLFTDLIGRAAEIAGRRSARRAGAALDAAESCFTCDQIRSGRPGRSRFAGQLGAVNTGGRAADWCLGCRQVWDERRCPTCTGRPDGQGVLCRAHALQTGARLPADYLTALAERVARCEKSMTADGPARTADTDAAVVEALGWCCGWRLDLAFKSWPT